MCSWSSGCSVLNCLLWCDSISPAVSIVQQGRIFAPSPLSPLLSYFSPSHIVWMGCGHGDCETKLKRLESVVTPVTIVKTIFDKLAKPSILALCNNSDFERKVYWNVEPLTSKDDQRTKRRKKKISFVCRFSSYILWVILSVAASVWCCLIVFGLCLMFAVLLRIRIHICICIYRYAFVYICLALVVTSDVALRT